MMKKISAKKVNKFFTTPLGTFTKVFLGAMVVFMIDNYLNDTLTFPLDKSFLKACLKAGIIAVAPMIYNYFNPHYEGYGKKGIEDLPSDPK